MENHKIENSLSFNSLPSKIMHIDLNSCFATIEQQANPFLRGKPVAIAAFTTDKGCILAASIEAKRLGIKTGMRVMDGKAIYQKLIVLPPDPWKYRNVHLKLRKLVSDYTNDFAPKSIDEFVLNLKDYSALKESPLKVVAQEIKDRIRREIGEWLTVSIGIAPNRYLAKIAAGLRKPDGLDEINKNNFLDVYSKLKLTGLTGIKEANAARLNGMGIHSVLDFYNAPIWRLRAAFHSITGFYWHTRLSGYEADDVENSRHSYGNSVAIGKNLSKTAELSPILARLTEKMCSRLRGAGYRAGGIHLTLVYKNGSWWHKGHSLPGSCFDSKDFYRAAFRLLLEANPNTPVLNLAVSCFGLTKSGSLQLEFFDDISKRESLVRAVDNINEKWGDFTLSSARSLGGAKIVLDRIAFGGIKELEELQSLLP
jgi:DNA polymerase-4